MKTGRVHLGLLILTFLVAACGASQPALQVSLATPGAKASPMARDTPIPTPAQPSLLPNQLVNADGKVTVRRRETSEFVPAGLGTEVEPGDVIRVEGGAAALFCGNEAQWNEGPIILAAGDSSVTCLAGRARQGARDLSGMRGKRSVVPGDIPYVLSPRTGFVLSDRPSLRWHLLPDVAVYSVTLSGDDGKQRPPVAAKGGEMAWPGAWPALQNDGSSYRVVLKAGERSSDEETPGAQKPWGFSLLDPASAAQLKALESELSARPLSPEAQALLLAQIYQGAPYRLRTEAAALLSAAGVGELPAGQVMLGEVYLDMGLVKEAGEAFTSGLTSSQNAGLPDFEARAELGLGSVACAELQWSVAKDHWQKAQDEFEALGMKSQAQCATAKLSSGEAECMSPTPTE